MSFTKKISSPEEIKVQTNLSNLNISPKVLSVNENEEGIYIEMEKINGLSLYKILNNITNLNKNEKFKYFVEKHLFGNNKINKIMKIMSKNFNCWIPSVKNILYDGRYYVVNFESMVWGKTEGLRDGLLKQLNFSWILTEIWEIIKNSEGEDSLDDNLYNFYTNKIFYKQKPPAKNSENK